MISVKLIISKLKAPKRRIKVITNMESIILGYLYFLATFSFYSLTVFSSCGIIERETVFLTEPSDISKREGETAIFSCSVLGFNAESDFLTWAVIPNLYTNVIS